jgi:RNA polymerase sigma-70 factor (ECF subfamily)
MESSERAWRERGLRDAVLAGDEKAWRALYAAAFDGLRAYAHWRCAGLCDLADEVVQETWLVAVRRIRAFAPESGSFAGWLRGIAANLLRNHLRRQVHRNGRLRKSAKGIVEPADAPLQRREEAERVARALAELPEHYEAVLRAKYLDGQSVADIAAERGESPKAVESQLTRARQAFREVYESKERTP